MIMINSEKAREINDQDGINQVNQLNAQLKNSLSTAEYNANCDPLQCCIDIFFKNNDVTEEANAISITSLPNDSSNDSIDNDATAGNNVEDSQ